MKETKPNASVTSKNLTKIKRSHTRKPHILMVDDEQTILDSFSRFLIKEGYAVTTARSGAAALDLLNDRTFDLAILDVLMPKMTGLELGQRIRINTKTSSLKIIFLTVVEMSGSQIKVATKKVKPIMWIRKPINIDVLRKAIVNALKI
jgi:DNA-binding response OmpR family regulator